MLAGGAPDSIKLSQAGASETHGKRNLYTLLKMVFSGEGDLGSGSK